MSDTSETAEVLSCDGQHESGLFCHSVLAHDAKTICSVDQMPEEPPVVHGYFKEELPSGTFCKLKVSNDGFPELFLND